MTVFSWKPLSSRIAHSGILTSFYFYEDFVLNPMGIIQDIFRFLEVNAGFDLKRSANEAMPLT